MPGWTGGNVMGEKTGKIRFRPDRNRWELDIHLDGQRIKRLFPSKSLAMEKLSELRRMKGLVESDLDLPFKLPKKQSQVAFNTLVSKFLTIRESSHTKQTFARELSIVTNHLAPFFRDILVSDIRIEHIDRYKTERLSDKISPATVRKELNVLSAIMTMAVKYRYLEHNILRDADRIRIPDRDPIFLNPEQAHSFLSCCSQDFLPLAMTYLYCGLRRDEAFNLTWDDVNFEQNELTIRAATSKTKRARTIPIHPELKTELMKQKLRIGESKFVFPGQYGKKRITCQHAFQKAKAKAKLSKRLRLHDLRHTWASNCLMSGIDPMTVKEWGGWSSIKLLDIYGHPDRRRDGEKINRLNYFGPQNVPKNESGVISHA